MASLRHTLFLIFLLLPLNTSTHAQSISLEYTTLSGDITSLQEGQIILIDWAASWCGTCKRNQANMNAIYAEYSDRVTFLTISYGGSGDTLEDVEELKGSYPWNFGLDHENKAAEFGVSNGHIWILSETLEVEKHWPYQVVSSSDMRSALNALLSGGSVSATSENTVLDDFGATSNPLVIAFLSFVVLMFGIIIFRGNTSVQQSGGKELLDSKIEEAKKTWDWNKEQEHS